VLPSFPLSACQWKTEHCQVGGLALSDVQNLAVNRTCSVCDQKHVCGWQLPKFQQAYITIMLKDTEFAVEITWQVNYADKFETN